MKKTLSVIIPCFNEEKYVNKLLIRLTEIELDFDFQKEIIIVNDGSQDQTQTIINLFKEEHPEVNIIALEHPLNKGKGACIKTAIPFITGEITVIQDADLEYDPKDFNSMLRPIYENEADVVFGSRFKGNKVHRGPFFFHRIGNKFFTRLINLLSGKNYTDIHTCYKMYKTPILKSITIKENRFGIDPEVVIKLSKRKEVRIIETGITYNGRSYSEGKKIIWVDAFRALYCIIKFQFFSK